jgi:hypothetical protein
MMRSTQSFFRFLLPCLLLPVTIGCSRSAASLEKLQSQILEDIVKQGGNSLKSVVCSSKEGEKLPQCLGILASGSGVDIEVKQKDDQSYEWNIPSVKGLLNMLQVQTVIQDELRKGVGEITLNCGGNQKYKDAKPGDMFDCQLTITQPVAIAQKPLPNGTKTSSDEAKSTDSTTSPKDETLLKPVPPPTKVAITILPSGDVNWQKVVPENKKAIKTNDKAAPAKTGDDKSTNDTKTQLPEESIDTKMSPKTELVPANSSSGSAKSADDFLNQAGATDDFE